MDPEFDAYLAIIGATCELIVVDGSPANLFEVNHRRWSKHLHVSVRFADDDVRFGSELFDLAERLASAEVVRP